MIERNSSKIIKNMAEQYPIVTVTGPRQSGKTTLCRQVFPDLSYVSLERPDLRDFAKKDPLGFLAQYNSGAIIDEVQLVPELFSYLQVEVDSDPRCGRFILTGSEHLSLSNRISQSLAGRTGIVHLLPPSFEELQRFDSKPHDLLNYIVTGCYPRIYHQNIPPQRWLSDYSANYIHRDVRQILNITDLDQFTDFLRICAGRTGCEINTSAMGNDLGISHNTVKAWISILLATFICIKLPAWNRSIKKQVIKAPKLHFLDTGLCCYLLGIRDANDLLTHPLRGQIFESWVVSEVYKQHWHAAEEPLCYHFRTAKGLEADLLINRGSKMFAVEIKSGATLKSDHIENLTKVEKLLGLDPLLAQIPLVAVYGGAESRRINNAHILPWNQIPGIMQL